MAEGKACCQTNVNLSGVYNRKLSLAMGIVVLVVGAALCGCAIGEFCIGALPTRGMVLGMIFFNISSGIYGVVAYKYTMQRHIRSTFFSCLIASILNLLFHIGQVVRIIYIVGFKSVGRDQDIDNPESAAAIMYTELCLVNVAMACQCVLTAISGNAVYGPCSQVAAAAQEAGEKKPSDLPEASQ